MIYTHNSSLRKTSGHYTAQQLYAAFEPMIPVSQRERARIAIDWIVVLSIRFDLDEVAVASIVWIETGYGNQGLPFRHPNFLEENNLGNLGKTGDPRQDAEAQTWDTIQDAVLGLVAHYVGYTYGKIWQSVWDVDELGKPQTWDWRFDLAINNTPNRAGVKTIGDLNRRWAIDRDDDYGGKLAERANKLVAAMDPPVTVPSTPEEPVGEEPTMPLIFGRVKKPKYIWAPVYKRPGAGYNQLSVARHLVGMGIHEWMGGGTEKFLKEFFACLAAGLCPSGWTCAAGERCGDALVDGFIMKDGTAILINDPWGTRAPWATGGGGPYRGDGAAFASVFGSGGFNSRLMSFEIVKLTNENYTQAQIQTLAEWSAYIHDQDEQRWDEHPYTSKYNCVTDILHFEAAATSCGENEIDDVTKVQAIAKQIMRSAQEGISVPDPIPPVVPPQPMPPLPGGADAAKASAAFGALRRVNTINDTITSGHGFDPGGPISIESTRLAVAAYGLDYSKWPKWEDWYVLNDSGKTLQLVTFSNDWRLVNPAERAGWSLMGFAENAIAA